MTNRQEYIDKMAKKLKEQNAELDKMEAKINGMQEKARLKYLTSIQELRLKKQDVQTKLERLQNTSENAWEEMKTGLNKSWDILKDSTEEALAKFKS